MEPKPGSLLGPNPPRLPKAGAVDAPKVELLHDPNGTAPAKVLLTTGADPARTAGSEEPWKYIASSALI